MKLKEYLKQLHDAFLRNDYDAQTEIARKLLWYEERGMVTNEMVMDSLKDCCIGGIAV